MLPAVVLGLILGVGAVWPRPPVPRTFVTDTGASQVARFMVQYSTGPVEGRIQPVEGTLTFDPALRDSGLSGAFSVEVENIDTGLGLRDRHLRNDYLETHRYDRADFVFDEAVPRNWQEADDGVIRFEIDGELTLHGVAKTETVEATLTPLGTGYGGIVRFDIFLTDYEIEPPTWLFLTVQDLVQVTVMLTLTPQE